MQAGRDTVVSLKIQVYDAQGALLHSPENPGESVQVQLEPEQAFGEYDAELLRVEPAGRYGQGVEVGMEIEEGERLYTVTDVAGGKVVLDGNHPLAGIALRFTVEIIAVRPARAEEIERGLSLP
jgi:FKBP-type peptidyl-prolyl cis-trans isomerase SlyD